MNQQAQASSQDNKDNQSLAPGEFVYEFFQPVFESSFNFDFSSPSKLPAVVQNETSQTGVNQIVSAAATTDPAAILPPAVSSLIETAFSFADNSADSTTKPAQEAIPASIDNLKHGSGATKSNSRVMVRQATNDSGAIIFYGRCNIKPHRIQYPDRSAAEFEYDQCERLIRVLDRDGMEWVRITQPDHKNISTWRSAEGQTCDMSMVVIPDGTYQVISAGGVIQTCTLNGRIVVWTPFTDGFDLKRTLFAIFRSVDKNKDSSLSKEELETAARQIWQEADAIQLISMLQTHYDAICATRRHALCRQGSGITIDDILGFDEATKNEQESRCSAPPHTLTMVRTLFDEFDIAGSGAVDINQIRLACDKRHERDSASAAILQTLYEELRRQYEGNGSSFASKASYLTRADLVQHYKDGYKREITGQIKIAGWGADECWQESETTTRTLFVDPGNPLESILPQAAKHRSADGEMAIFNAVFESIIVQCPHIIVRMICQTGDGKYTVTFPGDPRNPVTVCTPTSSCLAEYLHGSKFGFWMAVIENAYKLYQVEHAEANIDHLKSVERVCNLMNGQSGLWLSTAEMPLAELNNYMRDTFKQRRLMIAAGLRNSPRMSGNRFISKSAVCGIVNFDHRNGRVTVSDPLRDKTADSFSDPTQRNADGSTTLSLNAFVTAFDQIYVEKWLPSDHILHK